MHRRWNHTAPPKFPQGSASAAAFLAVACPLDGARAGPTSLEGSAGGGLVPWALLPAGTPTLSVHWVNTGDYNLGVLSASVPILNRVELSYAHQFFDIEGSNASAIVRTLGHSGGNIDIDVFGAKVKLLDMNQFHDWMPTVAAGMQYKNSNLDSGVLSAIGAEDDDGFDFYLAATKVLDAGGRNVLLDGTLRLTEANQIGILGFGGDKDDYTVQFETTAGVFINDQTVVGGEYRMKPDNLSGFGEKDWWCVFVAYMPSKHWSAVVAYTGLGDIIANASDLQAGSNVAEGEDQSGLYLQVQVNF